MLCRNCQNEGLCVIRQKLLESTVLEFPDGKTALVDMEKALVECDYYSPSGMPYGAGQEVTASEEPDMPIYDDDDDQGPIPGLDGPITFPGQSGEPQQPPETWSYDGSGAVQHSEGAQPAPPMPSPAPPSTPGGPRRLNLMNLGNLGR